VDESPAAPEEFSTETGYERAEHPPDMPISMEQDTNAESDQGGHSTDWMGREDEEKMKDSNHNISQPVPLVPLFPAVQVVRVSGSDSGCKNHVIAEVTLQKITRS
jgi:hypothetical protein